MTSSSISNSENFSSGKSAIIMGAGPAGLTAAIELQKVGIRPILVEKSGHPGGIAKTILFKGNRLDIGGHRFFSKSDRVMKWWLDYFPLETDAAAMAATSHSSSDRVMLVRVRRSSIFHAGQFFNYPLDPTLDTFKKLGYRKTFKIGVSYLKSLVHPIGSVENLEDFFINRFGRELYETFFKSYTEKVWGVSCREIDPSWGEQRVKGLSILKALLNSFLRLMRSPTDHRQKHTETSLIDKFLYPKFGPGQFWDHIADVIRQNGGLIHYNSTVTKIHVEGNTIKGIDVTARKSTQKETLTGDYYFSTIPVKEFVSITDKEIPPQIRDIAEGLVYRHFISVGILLKKSSVMRNKVYSIINHDNWIYIQEPAVQMGRVQIFNNWSPALVPNPDHLLFGVEYFCGEDDLLWRQSSEDMIRLASQELEKIHFCQQADILDALVIKMPQAYPGYMKDYRYFPQLRTYLDQIENLFLIGRNGTHRYNNQDHSMLTAMKAVENIVNGRKDKSNIWLVNTEQEYNEETRGSQSS